MSAASTSSSSSTTAATAVRKPTIWWGLDVTLEGYATYEETCAQLGLFKECYLPNAKQPADHKPHATVLYHGAAGATALRDAKLEDAHLQQTFLVGAFRALERHSSPDNKRHFLTACFRCEALQDLHVTMRAEAERISGAPSTQAPHLGPDGEHLHKNDVNTHITLAEYTTRGTMDADYDEMVAMKGDEWLLGTAAAPRKVRLGPLRAHYG